VAMRVTRIEKIRIKRVMQLILEEFSGPVDHEFFFSSSNHSAFKEIFPKISTTKSIDIINEIKE
jgi:hypothetical protein